MSKALTCPGSSLSSFSMTKAGPSPPLHIQNHSRDGCSLSCSSSMAGSRYYISQQMKRWWQRMLRNTIEHVSQLSYAIVTASSSPDCATASREALMRWILPSTPRYLPSPYLYLLGFRTNKSINAKIVKELFNIAASAT